MPFFIFGFIANIFKFVTNFINFINFISLFIKEILDFGLKWMQMSNELDKKGNYFI